MIAHVAPVGVHEYVPLVRPHGERRRFQLPLGRLLELRHLPRKAPVQTVRVPCVRRRQYPLVQERAPARPRPDVVYDRVVHRARRPTVCIRPIRILRRRIYQRRLCARRARAAGLACPIPVVLHEPVGAVRGPVVHRGRARRRRRRLLDHASALGPRGRCRCLLHLSLRLHFSLRAARPRTARGDRASRHSGFAGEEASYTVHSVQFVRCSASYSGGSAESEREGRVCAFVRRGVPFSQDTYTHALEEMP